MLNDFRIDIDFGVALTAFLLTNSFLLLYNCGAILYHVPVLYYAHHTYINYNQIIVNSNQDQIALNVNLSSIYIPDLKINPSKAIIDK